MKKKHDWDLKLDLNRRELFRIQVNNLLCFPEAVPVVTRTGLRMSNMQ